jgi:putative addiction module CopG family antidote
MPRQSVNLRPALEAFVKKQVSLGHFNNASEVHRSALSAMALQEEERALRLKQLRREIQVGRHPQARPLAASFEARRDAGRKHPPGLAAQEGRRPRHDLHDLDHERGTVTVRQGKGRKDRMIPIGERALAWTRCYLDEVRPGLVREPDDGTLFVTNLFEPFTPNRLTQLVRDYIDAADIG